MFAKQYSHHLPAGAGAAGMTGAPDRLDGKTVLAAHLLGLCAVAAFILALTVVLAQLLLWV
jgi:hypothetical protein